MPTLELTDQELNILQEMVKNTSVQGLEGMRIILALADKLESVAATTDTPQDGEGS